MKVALDTSVVVAVVRFTPLAVEPAGTFESLQRDEERARVHPEQEVVETLG